LLRALSNLAWNVSRNGASPTSPGSLSSVVPGGKNMNIDFNKTWSSSICSSIAHLAEQSVLWIGACNSWLAGGSSSGSASCCPALARYQGLDGCRMEHGGTSSSIATENSETSAWDEQCELHLTPALEVPLRNQSEISLVWHSC